MNYLELLGKKKFPIFLPIFHLAQIINPSVSIFRFICVLLCQFPKTKYCKILYMLHLKFRFLIITRMHSNDENKLIFFFSDTGFGVQKSSSSSSI
ncbi:hypothetical protein GDO78_007549 [Eleutherodactylus coqui]|uniref:Uncharacterized protein n=1 Tax=Eleutherodactylus coqui TaxID=57060 RepID=A0A8J6FJK3_ELECQ|nr:hypothetical protein GDO78_007549 [Eleutherodactylus coqui]